jgi:putative serine protease PepD
VKASTFMGATLATVTSDLKDRLGLSRDSGVLVNEVVPGSPAENAGLQAGDVITKFDGKDVTEAKDVVDSVQGHKPGDKVSVDFYRGTDKKTVTVTLGSRQVNNA